MPGYHVTVGYMPYRYRPDAIGPGSLAICAARARARGQPMPEFIDGSLMLCSTSTQRLEDYVVTIRETSWELPWCDWGSEVALAGPILGASRFLPTELPPADDLWWQQRDPTTLVKELAGLYSVPCKLHYYFCNYQGGVPPLETYTSMCVWRRTKFSAAEHLEVQVSWFAGVDCYVHYKHEFSRCYVFDHYSVLDIWQPTYFNVARNYVYRGRAEHLSWLLPPRISAM